MLTVELNPLETGLAEQVGTERYENDRAAGYTERKMSPRCGLEINIEGAGGELACSKILNVWPDLDTTRVKGYDLITGRGALVEVKTRREGGLLVRPSAHNLTPEFFILMRGALPRYKLVAVAHVSEIIHERALTDLGYGPTYLLDLMAHQWVPLNGEPKACLVRDPRAWVLGQGGYRDECDSKDIYI